MADPSSPDWLLPVGCLDSTAALTLLSAARKSTAVGDEPLLLLMRQGRVFWVAALQVAKSDEDTPTWTSRVWASPVDVKRRIFCNRALNMKSIVAVGFDMDYTLAQYRPETFETLAYSETVKKLVHKLGYPEELLRWEFDWRYMVRGLVLDKRRGNILKASQTSPLPASAAVSGHSPVVVSAKALHKLPHLARETGEVDGPSRMDRHKYVKVAYHGFRELLREERMGTYAGGGESFDEPDYALIDTLFSLAEAYLFAQLVNYCDAHPNALLGKDYAKIYKDVRAAVDLCHRDGTLKKAVAANPALYIHKDDHIVPMLKMLRDSGRMTFIVTNSLWDYTHVVMNYLCGKCGTDGGIPRDDTWLEHFDVCITGSAKPAFFLDGSRAPIFEVATSSGLLANTDDGSPLAQVGDVCSRPSFGNNIHQGCRVFQGGSVAHLHRMLGISNGSQVLYVGDHIYGDILRSKKQMGKLLMQAFDARPACNSLEEECWRTMLVVPELARELQLLRQTQVIRREFHALRQQRDALDDSIQRLEWAIKFEDSTEESRAEFIHNIENLQVQRDAVRELHRKAQQDCHQMFHKVWGQLMKTGYQNSRFAHQVERFACLYTSHVGNLCYYSPDKSYRTCEDLLPHEFDIIDIVEGPLLPTICTEDGTPSKFHT
eukprot:SM000060S19699  [mRNA]  locus=s60:664713:669200:- [translate_table: standard]